MRKLPTGEPCAGEPHARFGGRGRRKPFPDPYQVCVAELAWIPAFAGMTDPGCLFASRTGIFEGDDKNNW
jgi:hypothetical protein